MAVGRPAVTSAPCFGSREAPGKDKSLQVTGPVSASVTHRPLRAVAPPTGRRGAGQDPLPRVPPPKHR